MPGRSRRLRLRLFNALLAVALLPGALLSDTPPPATPQPESGSVSATTEVTLVEVPINVVGRDGYPYRGLRKEDFEILDDGARVEISDFETIDLEDFSKGVGTPQDMTMPRAARRHFLLLFDLSFSAPIKMARARKAAHDFVLHGMRNGDFASVATHDVEKGLKLILAFTADRELLARSVETLGLPSLTQAMADPLAMAFNMGNVNVNYADAASLSEGNATVADREMAAILEAAATMSRRGFDSYQRTRITNLINSFGDLAKTLNSVKGRKHILLFSEGFDSRLIVGATSGTAGRKEGDAVAHGETWNVDSEHRFGNTLLKEQLAEMHGLFRKTDCVIHAIDISGLGDLATGVEVVGVGDTGPSDRDPGRGRGQDSLFMLAHETGGEVFKNSNDVASHLEKLQKQTSLVYLVVISPNRAIAPGRFHELKVKVRAPGARVSARAGYYEPRPYSALTPMEKRLATAQLIAWGLPRNEIPAQILAAPFPIQGRNLAEVPVIIEIPGEKLLAAVALPGAPEPPDQAHVEIYAYVNDQALRVRDFFSQSLTLDIPTVGATLRAGGLKFYGTVFLPPGSFWLKVLIRNLDTGRTGLQIVPVNVPVQDRTEPFALTPFFHEAPGRWVMVKGKPRTNRPPTDYPFVFGGESFIPSAGPVLSSSVDASLTLMAYNTEEGVEIEGRVKGRDGKDYGTRSLKRVGEPEPGPGHLQKLLCSFRPEGLNAGAYSLLVTVRSAGAQSQSAIPFEVR